MSGELYLLTPITSPMVTRPASPDTTAGGAPLPPTALGYIPDATAYLSAPSLVTAGGQCIVQAPDSHSHMQEASTAVVPDNRPASLEGPAVRGTEVSQAESITEEAGATPWNLLSSAVGAAISKVRSASSSPKAAPAQSVDSGDSLGSPASSRRGLAVLLAKHQQPQRHWKSPPCCSGCGAAKADGGDCSGCGNVFCKACVAPTAAGAGRAGLGGPCNNCNTLCSVCKPIACSFCDERIEASNPNSSRTRMCEACAGTCDSCKRAACGTCAAAFVSCSSCGYASCEECRLQAQMTAGAATAGGGVVGGCWCAPPLRTASNVRHVSSQRYQMSQLHPSVLACSMEAVGLRDADFDDFDTYNEDYDSYNEHDDTEFTGNLRGESSSPGLGSERSNVAGGLGTSHGTGASSLEGSWVSGHLDPKTLGAMLEGLGCGVSPGSSHGSSSHVMYGSYGSYGGSAAGFMHRQPGSGAAADRYAGVKGAVVREGLVR